MIYLYKRGTGMGRIARRLGLSIMVANGTPITRRHNEPHLNWGWVNLLPEGAEINPEAPKILNHNIRPAFYKARAFELFNKAGVRCPIWDTDGNALHKRLVELKRRHMLARRDGLSKGRGINLVCLDANKIPTADFFVEKLSCQREFRIHVWLGEVICTQAKMVPVGCKNFIHNFENGCVYTTLDLARFAPSNEIDSLAKSAIKALGLDFGAVDILVTKKGVPYVLEVNTAPGLRSTPTRMAYTKALTALIERNP